MLHTGNIKNSNQTYNFVQIDLYFTDHKSILKKDHTSTNTCDDPFANEVVSQKKKKRKKSITVCTVHCRFDVVRRVTAALGMKDVDENEPWDVCFSDNNITIEKSKDMKRFQRINHFPGMIEICRLISSTFFQFESKNFHNDLFQERLPR